MSDEPVDGGPGGDGGEPDAVGADDHTSRPVAGDDPPSRGREASDAGPSGASVGERAEPTDEHGFWQWRAREVEVPMRVYKTVTVFATLFAVAAVLLGFVLLDHATNRAQLPLSDVDAGVALLGVGSIVFGAAIYAYSTRFRAAGMGKPNSDGNQDESDG